MKKREIGIIVALLLLLATGISVFAATIGGAQQEINRIQQEVNKTRARLKELDSLRSDVEKYMKGAKGVSVENRLRVLRLIENLCLGTAAVGYRTESLHGAGSPQAQRIMISRQGNIPMKKELAKKIAKIKD